jgi:hypothetical protein
MLEFFPRMFFLIIVVVIIIQMQRVLDTQITPSSQGAKLSVGC